MNENLGDSYEGDADKNNCIHFAMNFAIFLLDGKKSVQKETRLDCCFGDFFSPESA